MELIHTRWLVLGRIVQALLIKMHAIAKAWLLRTDVGRWRMVAATVEPGMAERNCLIAQMIPEGSHVLDLGSGAQTLANYLKPGCTYQPCDCVKSTDNVILCDFNRDWFPAIDHEFDYVVVSGVLEYIRKPTGFLERIRTYGRVLIISYADWRPGQTRIWRSSEGWVNHKTRSQLERIFANLDLAYDRVGSWQEQIIYRIEWKPETSAGNPLERRCR